MSKRNGFTIVEMMVAFTVFLIFAGIAFTFYHVQSRQGAGSAKKKQASEAATLAIATIKKDILQAGMGLREQPALSLFVVNGSGATPDQLYLSCAEYLDMDLSPDRSNSFFDSAAAPGSGKAWFQLTSAHQMVVSNVSRFIDSKALDSAITSIAPRYAQLSTVGPQGTVDTTTNSQTLQMVLPGGFTTGTAAPATSYKLDLTGSGNVYTKGRLLRNGVALIGIDNAETHLPTMKLTDFRVRCEFSQGAGIYKWSPDDGGFATFPITSLRLVEVTFRFIYRDEGGGFNTPNDVTTSGYRIPGDSTPGPWMIGGPRTVRVSPRNLVLESYL